MEENKLLDWARRHLSKLLIALLCLGALGIFADRQFTSKNSNAKKDFITIRQLFDRFSRGEPLSSESIASAERILAHHPELHPHYDPLLALSFFQQENPAKGIAYGDAILKRSEKLSHTPYSLFGKISLLIASQNYVEACSQTQHLEDLLRSQPSLETLRAFNLIRLAFLAKELKDQPLEKHSWMTVQTLPVFSQISPLFEEGTFKLKDYFKE